MSKAPQFLNSSIPQFLSSFKIVDNFYQNIFVFYNKNTTFVV